MRQAIGFCDAIELALKSGDSALPFSVLREVSIVSVGNGIPRISTLNQQFRVSNSCSRKGLEAVLESKSPQDVFQSSRVRSGWEYCVTRYVRRYEDTR